MRSFVGKKVKITLINGIPYRGEIESIAVGGEIALIRSPGDLVVFPYHAVLMVEIVDERRMSLERKADNFRLENL